VCIVVYGCSRTPRLLVNEMLGGDFFGVSQAEASGSGECREVVSKRKITDGPETSMVPIKVMHHKAYST